MLILNGKSYSIAQDLVLDNDSIPLTWWAGAPNFGDILSPYLVQKITSKPVRYVFLRPGNKRKFKSLNFRNPQFSYFAIGSIISRVNSNSVVWGSGAFGVENENHLTRETKYLAVRGPLTRNLLRIHGGDCPEIYGDPALLLPEVFNPKVEKKYKIGVILRWSEREWNKTEFGHDVKKIYLGTEDIEGTMLDILSCEKIISSSLHGIVLADAYGIPSAWLSSTTPKGFEFKFYDYFLSVNKIQKPQSFDFSSKKILIKDLEKQLQFDDRKIEFDANKLLEACPFIKVI
ncbi:MAG: polysaccharide pyruvyl transferase family protein [Bacteroidota bacterium]|nr:polysaccharide pyruvyl transferase family protein [Bacteroidota bacterium]